MKRRRLRWIAGAAAVLLAAACLSGIFVLRSQWFLRKLHSKLVSVVETVTGGRAEIGAIEFDWRTLRASVTPFTLHGTEPAGDPPLFEAASIRIGLQVLSLSRREIDLRELEIRQPRIYLIVAADGRTNIPGPKTNGAHRSPMDTLLDLAVKHFQVDGGDFQVNRQAPQPFSARGQNLQLRFQYEQREPRGDLGIEPRYRGDLAMDPLEVHWPGMAQLPAVSIQTTVALERNRIHVTAGRMTAGDSSVDFAGTLENLAAPDSKFQIDAHISVPEAARLAHIPELRSGTAQVSGTAIWSQASGASLAGQMHASGLTYRDSSVDLANFRVDGSVEANAQGIDLRGAHVAGTCTALRAPAAKPVRIPVEGQIGRVSLRGRDLDLAGIALAALGGRFQGTAQLRNWRQYRVEGAVTGFRVRQAAAIYGAEPLPWDAQISGSVNLQGAFGAPDLLRASGEWDIEPAPDSAPVRGHINASYAAETGMLAMNRSTLALPSSRIDFSGALDTQLHIHLETRDFGDLLPAAGRSAASLPLKLENGLAVFDGTVTGQLDHARIAGHLRAANLTYSGRRLDTIETDVAAASDSLRVTNGAATLGSLRAQFQGQVGMAQWKTADGSSVAGTASLAAANLPEVLALVQAPTQDASGSVSGSVQASGTIGDPILAGQVSVTKGAFHGEPFDRIAAEFRGAGKRIEVPEGEVVAGSKQARFTATLEHAAGVFDAGKLHFQVATNAMPLDEVRTLADSRPGLSGSVTLIANGDASLANSQVELSNLQAEMQGRGLQLTGQALGDATLTAHSEGQVLRAHLASNFADSQVQGDGEWRLEGGDPGTATLTFSRLDFAQLQAWIAPQAADSKTRAEPPVAGFAEGQLRLEGPLMNRAQWRGEVRVGAFEIRPADATPAQSNSKQTTPAPAIPLALRNSGPIVARMENSVFTVESAHLTGRSTDVAVTGRVLLDRQNPLDLRINGQVDLALLHDLDRDFTSSGTVATDATVRGSLANPQIVGRVQFANASFNLVDFPNGISNANGSIAFTKDRATIQSFSGETGGGKVELSGFAGYTGGSIIYRMHARADHVRVRYPEGVSTVADASLNLTGTRDQSVLSGTVTVLRTGFNPQGDFSSLIASSAEPVRTPSAQTGLLGGMSFSIQINTAPDIQFQSVLTSGLQVDANLTLRGSPSNPALLGRITITQGRVIFYGTKFNINQGSISFFNPLRIDPVLDIDLETKERGIDVILTVSGPLTHPNLTPHSDPPLQFSEIVALLATGEGPSSDPTLLQQQSTAPQSWQQMGATALLGQAIASPVSGRLQRFFGVSNLRIDPTMPGVENNPQARLTLEQQISSAITFTYITNVTSSNPQVVRIEWALSKQWSVVALREDNGVFGIDFYLKKRF